MRGGLVAPLTPPGRLAVLALASVAGAWVLPALTGPRATCCSTITGAPPTPTPTPPTSVSVSPPTPPATVTVSLTTRPVVTVTVTHTAAPAPTGPGDPSCMDWLVHHAPPGSMPDNVARQLKEKWVPGLCEMTRIIFGSKDRPPRS